VLDINPAVEKLDSGSDISDPVETLEAFFGASLLIGNGFGGVLPYAFECTWSYAALLANSSFGYWKLSLSIKGRSKFLNTGATGLGTRRCLDAVYVN